MKICLSFLRLVLLASLLAALAPALPAAQARSLPDGAAPVRANPAAPAAPAGLPPGASAGWWASVQEQIRRSEYDITWQDDTYLPDLPAAYQAPNRRHNLRTYFAPGGPIVLSRLDPGAWRVDLRLAAWGWAGAEQPPGAATLAAWGNRIEYRYRSGLVEWYANAGEGLEQGFTLPSPAGGGETIVLHLALDTDLAARLAADGTAIDLAGAPGAALLRYGDLYAVDAAGRSLPSSLALQGTGGGAQTGILLTIDASGAAFPISVDPLITGLSQSVPWTAESDQANALLGCTVGTAGDVNKDGYDDVIVGAYMYDNGQANEGRAFVYHGSPTGPSPSFSWTAESNQADAYLGGSAGTAGDVNKDGYDDVIVGAGYYDNPEGDEGAAFVYHGSASGLSAGPNWTAESNQAGAQLGSAVGTAGDVDGDGYADVVVGAFNYNNGQAGEGLVLVYRGSAAGLGTNGTPANAAWMAEGDQAGAYFGSAVGTAGDVNGDGYADLIVGALQYDNVRTDEGVAFVYHGSASGLGPGGTPANADWRAAGNQDYAGFGIAAGAAGDVNGDGFADVVVGAYRYDNGQADEGRAYVYHGSAAGLSTTANWTAESDQAGAGLGYSAGAAGDVNGDGYADLAVGASSYDNGQTDEGRAYVYHGSAAGLSPAAAWTAEGSQAGARLGIAVGAAGDVNGDGYADLVVGAYGYSNGQTAEGRAYAYYGSAAGLDTPGWAVESDQGGAYLGYAVGAAGDVNGDGYDDLAAAATYFDNGQADEGRVFVYHGSAAGPGATADWTAEGNQASARFGCSVGTAGDVNGDGYADLIVGADGYSNGQASEGQVLVYHGSAAGLTVGAAGWTDEADLVGASLGSSVGTAGDVNGDGYADIAVGAYSYTNGQANEGRALVYHGSASGLSANPNWAVESDMAGALLGVAIGTAGDVNGDGYADLIVGARNYSSGQTYEGAAFVYHGSASGLIAGAANWTAEANQAGANFGQAVGTAGDVNGDGYADVVVTAPDYDGAKPGEGLAVVWHGSATGLGSNGTPANADWSAEGGQANASFGYSAGTAGDVNGDGYADVIVGANYYDTAYGDAGRVLVYHGSASGLVAGAAWTADGSHGGASFGCAVSTAGDVNGDGYADILVGERRYTNGQGNEGRVTLYYGSAGGPSPIANWTGESDLAGAWFGSSVGTAGDVNGDGYADVIVGAYHLTNGHTEEGRVYVYHGSASGLSATPNWTVESNQGGALFGRAVGTAGDVNGDGYADVIVGAIRYTNGESGEGAAFVYHGSATGLSATPNWTAEGNQVDAYFGCHVGTAGDVNGDGYADVVVGAELYDNGQTDEGRAYVYHGSAAGLSPSANWTAEGDQIGAQLGHAVGTAGDVNGDGYADVVVGALMYDNGQADEGRALVYHGSAAGLTVGAADWTAESDQVNAQLGQYVGTAGDVNGDGYDDLILGAHLYDNGQTDEGRAFVYHGSAAGLATGGANWTAESDQANAWLGLCVGTAGDVNGDGYADVAIGARMYDNGQTDEGRVYAYHGSAAGLSAAAGWSAESDQSDAWFGNSVGTAGDVNGDGYDDLIVGAPLYEYDQSDEGRAYVYQGNRSLPGSAIWAAEVDQTGAQMGSVVGAADDVNGDGYADLIAGAPYFDNGQTDEGRAYVYYGSAAGLDTSPDWTAESDQANAYFGYSAGTAGDVNGDGYDDVIVGTVAWDNGHTDEGRASVYYGSAAGLSATAAWTAEANQDNAQLGVSVGTAGDVNGDGYADVIVGALAYDNDHADEGCALVYRGSATGLPTGAASWMAESHQSGSQFGWSVATAGDVNGDGYADVIVGAPYYDNGHNDEGQAYVYHGSASGLSAGANWTAESNQVSALLGYSVGTAGDANGDGYDDIAVGSLTYDNGQTDEGLALAWYGSSTGLGAGGNPGNAGWTVEGNRNNANLGWSIGTAGDTNRDGYADLVVGAYHYSNDQSNEGRAYLYQGAAAGLSTTASWQAEGNQIGAQLGFSVGAAGDVNGDGYDDVAIGARWQDNGQTDAGRAYVYYMNRSPAGLALHPQQRRAGDSAAIAPGGQSISPTEARLAALARTPWGRSQVRLQWEAKPEGTAFDGTGLGQSAWQEGATAGHAFDELVSGLSFETRYHWRVRILGRPARAAANSAVTYRSRWLRPAGNTFFTALSGQQTIGGAGPTSLLGQSSSIDVTTQGNLTGLTLRGYPFTAHPQENVAGRGARALDRYYTITPNDSPGSFDLRLCLAYRDADLPPAVTEGDLFACRWTGATWSCFPRGAGSDTGANLVCAANVTTLSDWILTDSPPTAVTLANLAAWPAAGAIHIKWETAAEVDTIGFHLYRGESAGSTYTRLNEALIPGQAPGSLAGAVYLWVDAGVQPGLTYYYQLEAVDLYGQGQRFGPVHATAAIWHRLYLPLVVR